jgi:hypothetical protein
MLSLKLNLGLLGNLLRARKAFIAHPVHTKVAKNCSSGHVVRTAVYGIWIEC